MAAGLKPIWGIEYDPKIVAVAKANGLDFMVADVREVDYTTLETPYWLHMSPVCKRASIANSTPGETKEDIETAEACIRAITTLKPSMVSIENVEQYQGFKAFHLIVRALMDEGYNLAWWLLNSANFGVPQGRVRLILVASRVSQIKKPYSTHNKEWSSDIQPLLFESDTKQIVSWYEGTKDLIPNLHKGVLANFLKDSLPDPLTPYTLTTSNIREGCVIHSTKNQPSKTVVASASAMASWKIWDGEQWLCITARFVARLQGFPDSYQEIGTKTLMMKVFGNALPPPLMQAVMEAQAIAQKAVA